jgi:hypothetical protein
MFTIKCFTDGGRCVIREAESFTILRDNKSGEAEITIHHPAGDSRVDVKDVHSDRPLDVHLPPIFQWAYIENAAGKTVERIHLRPAEASRDKAA